MPLNKLENFIKNVEGRILYVNPNDLDATDGINNQGNSLAQPFKTVQRALLESARFSYLKGNNNDITEKTTILLFPGEHAIDNRPGYAIKDIGGTAYSISPSGEQTAASTELTLTLDSNFDITSSDNILYKFNSINGGVVVPRGTSIVSLDLRKTKIRPKYVPNPTDPNVDSSSIFRITGACYFWQLSFFDGDENTLVYTDSRDFSIGNRSKPTFSHHKLTCFEYADGTNIPSGYDISDLDMYYSKLSNAFNRASGRDIDQKFPSNALGFSKQRPEWEIVGAFATDPVTISSITSGDGFTPSNLITVTTTEPHGLTSGTPIKINGVNVEDYNVSTKVQNVNSLYQFTYLLPFVRNNLPASPSISGADVTIETDTVSGASPYIFNVSLRSVWGMSGMHADGSKASGFKSMVVAQFTGVSLQKDDRAFVKYNRTSRKYESITLSTVSGSELSSGSSSTNINSAYHLDSDAIYRSGWESSHIKISNDGFVQVVSVFAIGFTKHFDCQNGGDVSITNSNSNFGQLALSSYGFRNEAFAKDDNAYITSIISPRAVVSEKSLIDWQAFDVGLTTSVGISSHLYLFGFTEKTDLPPVIGQAYRIGAKVDDRVFVSANGNTYSASINMVDNFINNVAYGSNVSFKEYKVVSGPSGSPSNILNIGTHNLQTGEKILVLSDNGDIPENLFENIVYYAIRHSSTEIKIAASKTNADSGTAITIYGGSKVKIVSRVSDKNAGDIGSPVQYDDENSNWFLHVNSNNDIYNIFNSLGEAVLTDRSEVSYFERYNDIRGLDEKIYKLRVVIPKESINAKDPTEGYVIQESSSTGARSEYDFTLTDITSTDYAYNKNLRLISKCSQADNIVTVITEKPHNLSIGDVVVIKNIQSSTNTSGENGIGFNGTFEVSTITGDKSFTYSIVDIDGVTHNVGTFVNNTSTRNVFLPRFERKDLKKNFYIYRSDTISPYIYNVQDGIYHLYVLNADNEITEEFSNLKFSQPVIDLYPQLDRDNIDENPQAAKCFAKRSPVGDVVTNDVKKSVTKETIDKMAVSLGFGLKIIGVSTTYTSQTSGTATLLFDRPHNLSGIATYSSISRGNSYTPGTYYNVKLYNTGTTTWDGATAKVVVAGSASSITSVDIMTGGSAYTHGEVLEFDTTVIGSGNGASITITNSGISSAINNVIQTTGVTTATDGYFRITSIPSTTQVSIAVTNGDPKIEVDQYIFNVGKSIRVTSSSYDSSNGYMTFNCSGSHGLLIGNKFKVVDSNNNSLGNYIVNEVTNLTTFKSLTNLSLSPSRIFKHGLSANDAQSDIQGENLGIRGQFIYDNERLDLITAITTENYLEVQTLESESSITRRFPLGSYIQVGSEIMRIITSTLSGSNLNQIYVIRGALGTQIQSHPVGSLIQKIKPIAIEFRRPAIIRASGHTFEYLGYGPGNYSTSLPQVQVKSLTEREEFLSQSQERSSGIVVYTGMNNNGDFFIGNTKYSSTSGKQKTFDIPTPTVTGQDPSRLSVVFDEVTIKERLLVEGGNSGTILSQFNGPVLMNKDVKINGAVNVNNTLKVRDGIRIDSTTQSTDKDTGSLVVEGGIGIEKNLNIGGLTNISGLLRVTGVSTFVGVSTFSSNLFVGGNTSLAGTLTINGGSGGTALTLRNGGNLVLNNAANTGTASIFCDTNNELRTDNNLYVGGKLDVVGDITAFYSSDKRLKDNINPIINALDKVTSISGNTFTWNDKSTHSGEDVGVIAQEVESVLPQVVKTRENGYKAVQYEKLVPLLIEAIKDLNNKLNLINNQSNK